jgi:hypothetical protein
VAGGATGQLQAVRMAAGWVGVVAGRYPQSTATANLARFREPGSAQIHPVILSGGSGTRLCVRAQVKSPINLRLLYFIEM